MDKDAAFHEVLFIMFVQACTQAEDQVSYRGFVFLKPSCGVDVEASYMWYFYSPLFYIT